MTILDDVLSTYYMRTRNEGSTNAALAELSSLRARLEAAEKRAEKAEKLLKDVQQFFCFQSISYANGNTDPAGQHDEGEYYGRIAEKELLSAIVALLATPAPEVSKADLHDPLDDGRV